MTKQAIIDQLETLPCRQWISAVYGPVPATGPGGAKRTKAQAWEDCMRLGLAQGIPAHAWVKCHNDRGWMWRTTGMNKIRQKERAIRRTNQPTERT